MSDADVTLNDAIPLIDPIISVATQLLCIGAIVAASTYTVKRWTAVKSLTPPAPIPFQKKPEGPPRKGLKKVFNEETGPPIFGTVVGLSVFGFSNFGPQIIKNQKVLNGYWSGVVVFLYVLIFYRSSRAALHPDTEVALIATTTKHGYDLKFTKQTRSKLWTAGCALLAAALPVSFSMGYQLPAPLMAASYAFVSVATLIGPRTTIRHMVMFLNGSLIFCIALSAIIGAFAAAFGPEPKADKAPEKNKKDEMVIQSLWVTELMMSCLSALPACIPGSMLALTMRFEHSRTNQNSLTTTTPGEAIRIPRSVSSFARPTFNAGLFAMIASIAGLKVITQMYIPGAASIAELGYIFVTVPATTLGLVLGAWKQGQLRAWWLYEETWVPKAERKEENGEEGQVDTDVEAAGQLERVAAEATENEKQKLLA